MTPTQSALSPDQITLVAAQLAHVYRRGDSFRSDVAADDEMFRFSVDSVPGIVPCGALLYFVKGLQIYSVVEEVCRWRFGDRGRNLDLASGWGRLTRFLAELVASSQIFAADTVAQAMAAQAELFGIETFVTNASPAVSGRCGPRKNRTSDILRELG